MTDDTGLFQHARLGVPDLHHGYCIDDNARALIAAVNSSLDEKRDAGFIGWHPNVMVDRYLRFIAYALDPQTRRFRNFMGYDRRWLEAVGSNDSQGRTVWALGAAVRDAPCAYQRDLAGMLLDEALHGVMELDSLRSWAFALIGLDAAIAATEPDKNNGLDEIFLVVAHRLIDTYTAFATDDWPWWESVVTYDNARLPQAMLLAGRRLDRPDVSDQALTALCWLIDQQTDPDRGHLSVIGNDGWMTRDGKRANFDQQPLEAHALVDACLLALETTDDEKWPRHARWAFDWFTGHNDAGLSLVDPETGGGQDGLTPRGVNRNQGAESLLAYVLSSQAMRRHAVTQPSAPPSSSG